MRKTERLVFDNLSAVISELFKDKRRAAHKKKHCTLALDLALMKPENALRNVTNHFTHTTTHNSVKYLISDIPAYSVTTAQLADRKSQQVTIWRRSVRQGAH